MIKTPKFYYKKIGILACFLLPLSTIFWFITLLKNFFGKNVKLNKKIICVGNASLGGAGKTPVCIFIGELLKEEGVNFCFLSKGYGRKVKGFRRVLSGSPYAEVGDEPLLLSKIAPTYVFSKWKQIPSALHEIKEDVIILDDGMQNLFLRKDLTIMVVDNTLRFGNNLLFPAGPLRERVKSAIHKSDMVFGIEGLPKRELQDFKKERFVLKKQYEFSSSSASKTDNFLAFSGLANNEKFFRSLKEHNIKVVKTAEFKDHHAYSQTEIETLQSQGLKLITTEKDIVKIPNSPFVSVLKMKLAAINQKDKEKIRNALINLLTKS